MTPVDYLHFVAYFYHVVGIDVVIINTVIKATLSIVASPSLSSIEMCHKSEPFALLIVVSAAYPRSDIYLPT